ncbi:MAG: ARPP-1 family domain-containing protein [Bradymonadaceae bacterium]
MRCTQSIVDYANLSFVPLEVDEERKEELSDYMLFGDADEEGLVEVTERSSGEEAVIERVEVTNRADARLVLLRGVVLLGGMQDRVVARTTVIPADAEEVEVPTRCIEHGRWGPGGGAESGDELSAVKKLADSRVKQSSSRSRAQRRVWREVSESNRSVGESPRTGSYRASLGKTDEAGEVGAYVENLLPSLCDREESAGVVVGLDGEPIALEALATPGLFDGILAQLVESYALEAVARSREGADGRSGDMSVQQARAFRRRVERAQRVESRSAGLGENVRRRIDDIDGWTTVVDERRVSEFFRRLPADEPRTEREAGR